MELREKLEGDGDDFGDFVSFIPSSPQFVILMFKIACERTRIHVT